MRITEKCSCGASIEVEAEIAYRVDSTRFVKEWRAKHQHTARAYGYPYVTYGAGGGQALPYTHTFTINNGDDNPPNLSVVNS
jgi:hypothetical protein